MARSFSGAAQYINLGNTTSGPLKVAANSPIAVVCWVNFASLAANQPLITKGYDQSTTSWELKTSSTTQLVFDSYNGSVHGVSFTHGYNTGEWHHVYADYTGTTWNIASDGSLKTPSVDATGPQSNNMACGIGGVYVQGGGWQFVCTATIADAAIWSTALTAGEVSALASGIRPYMVRPKSILGYWPLDGLSSPEADLSGNASNGTLSTSNPTWAAGPPATMFTPRWPRNYDVVAATVPLSQTHFRFRTDTGAVDGTPTWAANEDTNGYNPDTNKFRIRVKVENP